VVPETIGCSGIKDSGKEVRNMECGKMFDVKIFSKLICIYIYFVSWECFKRNVLKSIK
jgi:hypothetical protein